MSVAVSRHYGPGAGASVRDLPPAPAAQARAEAAAMAEQLELKRQRLVAQRARLDAEIERVTAERRLCDLRAYAASKVHPCPDCGQPQDGVEQSWIGGVGWVFGVYCRGCRLAAQGIEDTDLEAPA